MMTLTVRSEGAIREDVRAYATAHRGPLELLFLIPAGILVYALMDHSPLAGAARASVLLSWAELFALAGVIVGILTARADFLDHLRRLIAIPPRAPAQVVAPPPTPRREPVDRLAGSVDRTAPPAHTSACACGQAQTVTPAGGSIRHP